MLSFRYETVSSKLLLHDSLVAVNNAFVDDEMSTSSAETRTQENLKNE